MTSGWNASSWHRHYLYSAALLYFYATHHHFSFLISHSIEAFNRNQGAARPMSLPPFPIKRRCEITIISFSRSICRGGLAALRGVTGKPYPSCLSCHSHPIRPFRAPSPRGEGCDTRIPSSKKRRRSRHESPEP